VIARRTNVVDDATGMFEFTVDPATGALRWKYTTNGQCVASAPVANGTIYVASNDHSLYALDAATGGLLWKATTGNFLDASPAVSNGIVYEGSDDGALYAYNAYNGAQLWKYQLPDWIQSSPAVVNGMVVVGDGRLPQQGTALDHNVYAFALPGAKPGSEQSWKTSRRKSPPSLSSRRGTLRPLEKRSAVLGGRVTQGPFLPDVDDGTDSAR